jgi:hypothetical protein
MGELMVYLVDSHTNAIRIGWHLWEIDLRFAPGLPPGWLLCADVLSRTSHSVRAGLDCLMCAEFARKP